jgi:hypothetical protein
MWLRTQSRRRWQYCQRGQKSRGYPQGSWHSRINILLVAVVIAVVSKSVEGFGYVPQRRTRLISLSLAMVEKDETYFEEDFAQGDDEQDSVLEDLNWRVIKLKLEEENTKRFLKSKPRYLPYDECRKWVSAWSRWSSETEW